mmetsp:Transcript_3565/g.3503  ORF Transcript_3565/g.3503 Transcript_3565/m.3503 type:complete len:208 (-) Transcript_3565:499-1122(-)
MTEEDKEESSDSKDDKKADKEEEKKEEVKEEKKESSKGFFQRIKNESIDFLKSDKGAFIKKLPMLKKEESKQALKNEKNSLVRIHPRDLSPISNKSRLLEEDKSAKESLRREMELERQREAEEFKRRATTKEMSKNVLPPQYRMDKRLNVMREVDPPPGSLYMSLGWDEFPEQNRKHYRRFYLNELEQVKEIMPRESPFDDYEIKRG